MVTPPLKYSWVHLLLHSPCPLHASQGDTHTRYLNPGLCLGVRSGGTHPTVILHPAQTSFHFLEKQVHPGSQSCWAMQVSLLVLGGWGEGRLGEKPREGRQPLHPQCASRARGRDSGSRSIPVTGARLRCESGANGDTWIVSVPWTAVPSGVWEGAERCAGVGGAGAEERLTEGEGSTTRRGPRAPTSSLRTPGEVW